MSSSEKIKNNINKMKNGLNKQADKAKEQLQKVNKKIGGLSLPLKILVISLIIIVIVAIIYLIVCALRKEKKEQVFFRYKTMENSDSFKIEEKKEKIDPITQKKTKEKEVTSYYLKDVKKGEAQLKNPKNNDFTFSFWLYAKNFEKDTVFLYKAASSPSTTATAAAASAPKNTFSIYFESNSKNIGAKADDEKKKKIKEFN